MPLTASAVRLSTTRPLEDEVEDHHRQREHEGDGEDRVVRSLYIGLEERDAKVEGVHLIAGEDDQRPQEGVPLEEKAEDGQRDEAVPASGRIHAGRSTISLAPSIRAASWNSFGDIEH